VLAPLPADFPAAVLVLQHLSPDTASPLAYILNQRTALPVSTAVQDQPLVPGQVLVAPSGHHLLVREPGMVALIDSGALPPARPSADLLLVTLAVTCGRRAIAAVLTGNGRDAQSGARAIVHCGGRLVVEADAAHPSMPAAAIDTGLADLLLPVDELAAGLIALVEEVRGQPDRGMP
jgi:two-component system chemotaxis response regulator CheB